MAGSLNSFLAPSTSSDSNLPFNRVKVSPEITLGLILNCRISKHAYEELVLITKAYGLDKFHPYSDILPAMELCFPKGIVVTPNMTSVPLKDLLQHTVRRLIEANEAELPCEVQKVPSSINAERVIDAVLSCNWGYNFQPHIWDSPEAPTLMAVNVRPVKMTCKDDEIVLWINKETKPIRTVRPVKLAVEAKSKKVIKSLKKDMEQQILELKTDDFKLGDNLTLRISYKIDFTPIGVLVQEPPCKPVTVPSSTRNIENDETVEDIFMRRLATSDPVIQRKYNDKSNNYNHEE